jgi:hypothetical protein
MLSVYSMFMMLLLAIASLVGISDMYQLTKVEAQPQVQQQPQGLALTQQEKELADRLLPNIIQRIDGQTLLQKIDAKTLAAKVLPFLDVKVAITERPGQTSPTKMGTVNIQHATPKCSGAETAVSAGFTHRVTGDLSVMHFKREPNTNAWEIATIIDDGTLRSFVECLRVGLALK